MSPVKKDKTIEIKVGQKFELSPNEDMWKDDLSGVFITNPSKSRVSRPFNTDYKTQLEWFNRNRLKDHNKTFFKDIKGNPWFEVTEGMNVSRIKVALSKGILCSKGKAKKIFANKKEKLPIFTTDPETGYEIYNGPNKNYWKLLQKNNIRALLSFIKEIHDVHILEVLLNMEQKGFNPASIPRGQVIVTIEEQLKKNAIGISKIIESENKDLKKDLEEDK